MERQRFGSIPQVALALGIHERILRAAVERGELASYHPPGFARAQMAYDEAEAWIRQHKVPTTLPPES